MPRLRRSCMGERRSRLEPTVPPIHGESFARPRLRRLCIGEDLRNCKETCCTHSRERGRRERPAPKRRGTFRKQLQRDDALPARRLSASPRQGNAATPEGWQSLAQARKPWESVPQQRGGEPRRRRHASIRVAGREDDLSRKLGRSQGFVSKYELGDRRIDLVRYG
jgi:hypothetical protein